MDTLTARVTYSPLECPSASSLKTLVAMSMDRQGQHRPSGLTPGIRYRTTVAVRPNATFIWPQDDYWSDDSDIEAPTPEAAPVAAPSFEFHKVSALVGHAIPISWQPLSCEKRGTSGPTIYEARITRVDDNGRQQLGEEQPETIELHDQPHYVVAGILPNAEYSVETRARNAKGAGPWSAAVLHRTPFSTLANPPREVGVEVTGSTATVVWRPSRHPYTPVSHYKLQLTNAQGAAALQEVVHYDLSRLRAVVSDDLAARTAYTVSVFECSQNGACGPPAASSFNTAAGP
jgi:hypothetical protein